MRALGVIAAAAAAITTTGPAFAAEPGSYWLLFANDDRLLLLDRNSIRWSGANPSVDWHVTFAVPYVTQAYGQTKYVQRQIERSEYDCNGRIRAVLVVRSEISGQFISRETSDGVWEQIRPNTLAEIAQDIVCKNDVSGSAEFTDLDATIANFLSYNQRQPPVVPPP